ncbi:putative protein S-acyltransferase 5 [Senna tora]|uniref:Protein S-acyltransferase n=1 Tax=Senna tora TaxID=362788 RepID=A0A834WX83_9FABA|nr:putative protein S-acyltransferase 5 [Senna tora]
MYPPLPAPAISDSSAAGDTDASSTVRTYRVWKGSNVFLLQGRLIFGPDVKSIFLSIFLIVAPVAVFCAFVARKLLDDFPHHSGLSIMIIVVVLTIFVLIVLLLTSGRDPGIVPRNAYPPELDDDDGSGRINNGQTPRLHLPVVLIVQCVTIVWSDLIITALGWVSVLDWRIMDSEEISIWKAMLKTPASFALIIYSFICVWFVGGLTAFHTYLISTNQSTYENFRYRYDREQVNPYNKGILKNFKEIFCTSIPPSKNKFRSKVKVPNEPSPPSRRVGVGSISPIMRKITSEVEMGERQAYSEAGEVESFKGGLSNDEERSKDSGLADVSLDLSRTLPTDGVEGPDAPYLSHSDWDRRSRKWDIDPQVLGRST